MKIQFFAIACLLPLWSCTEKPGSDSETESTSASAEMPEIKVDPVEADPRHADIFAKIDDEVEEALEDHPRKGQIGFVHTFWETKKRILKEKYQVDWRSPADLNPNIAFD